MSDVYFSNNPNEWEQLEGLYVSERNPTGLIETADLSKVGIFGQTVRGPSGVQLVTSTGRFLEVYGGRDYGSGGALVNEVWASLLNKKFSQLYIRRITASADVASSLTIETGVDGLGTAIARIDASSVGVWGQSVETRVVDATDGNANHWNLEVRYLNEYILIENIDTSAGNDNTAIKAGDDVGRFIDLTKLADGRPANYSTITEADWITKDTADNYMALGTTLTAYTSVTGTTGSLASADELAGASALTNTSGPSLIFMAGTPADANALNGQYVTDSASVFDRSFVTWSGTHGQAVAAEVSNLTTDITTRTDRIIWCFNSGYYVDQETKLQIQRPPCETMVSILSQTDVDIHPGSADTARMNAGIKKLTNESLSRADLIALRDAGISTLEKLSDGFRFRSGVTTDLTAGKKEITRRRMVDALQLGAADRIRYYVKEKNTPTKRAAMIGELVAFNEDLLGQERIVEGYQLDNQSVNNQSSRSRGVEKILWEVNLIDHMLHVVLETNMGTGVTIEASVS